MGIFLFPQPNIAQEINLFSDVNQDNLGEVTDEFQEYFFEALKQKAIENPEKAILALQKCLEIDPKPVVYFEMGKNYNSLEKYDQAAEHLIKAQKADPSNQAILAELYNTYFLSEQYDKALPVVKKLQKINPSYSEDLAHLYIVNQNYDEALSLLDSLDKKRGESEYRNGLRRQIYSQTNNVDAKIEMLNQKIAQNPADEENYLNLIFVYSEAGNAQKAFETAKKLLELKPSSQLVHLALYKFYLDENSFDKALESMKIVLKSPEVDEQTKHRVLQDFLLFVNKNPVQEPHLIEMVNLFSKSENNTKVYGELGTYYLKNNKKQLALKYFERAVENEIGNYNVIKNTLLLYLEFEKFEKAKTLSNEALGNFPSQPFLYLVNGKTLNRLKSFKEAQNILVSGLGFLIDNTEIEIKFYQELATAAAGLKNKEKASEFQRKVMKLKDSI